jgi:hypothetical protein
MIRIESLLSARLFVAPQSVGDRIFFLSNLSGHLSLYSMDFGGSVPEPLLPPHIALQNPDLMNGSSFVVFPQLGKILVMIDQNGDENYQPLLIPVDGGYPEPAFGDSFENYKVHCLEHDVDANTVYLYAESREESLSSAYRGDLSSGRLDKLGESPYGSFVGGYNSAHSKAILIDAYGVGDHVLFMAGDDSPERQLLYGLPLDQRDPGQEVPPNSLGACHFVDDDRALLLGTSLFSDMYGLG